MENVNLYVSVKRRICKLIFDGVYKEGAAIPPERILAEALGVSRVTLRKALKSLEDDGIIERIQGSGTTVRLGISGHTGTTDILTLVAPAQNPFFSSFIDAFQKTAESNDSLVLFKQKASSESLEDCLFSLCQRDLRNAVVWPGDISISKESLKKLRGLGMNIVLFDVSIKSPYADCVYLNNADAVNKLCESLHKRGAEKIGYIGWDRKDIWSATEREAAFLSKEPNGKIECKLAWALKKNLDSVAAEFAESFGKESDSPDALIFGDGEIGVAFAKAFKNKRDKLKKPVILGSVDEFSDSGALSLTTYAQDFDAISQKVYECLTKQNLSSQEWKANLYPINGYLTER